MFLIQEKDVVRPLYDKAIAHARDHPENFNLAMVVATKRRSGVPALMPATEEEDDEIVVFDAENKRGDEKEGKVEESIKIVNGKTRRKRKRVRKKRGKKQSG